MKQQIALAATKLLHDPEQHCRELQPLIQLVSSRDEVVSASENISAVAVLHESHSRQTFRTQSL